VRAANLRDAAAHLEAGLCLSAPQSERKVETPAGGCGQDRPIRAPHGTQERADVGPRQHAGGGRWVRLARREDVGNAESLAGRAKSKRWQFSGSVGELVLSVRRQTQFSRGWGRPGVQGGLHGSSFSAAFPNRRQDCLEPSLADDGRGKPLLLLLTTFQRLG